MSAIHQIYCTHCTHGTSALERREGELAHRMLGYSARAGSLDARELRRSYRQVERYAYYYLPRDAPAEEKLRLTAASAPRRLVYHPSTGGLQVIGQVCYRQTDTDGRPGSYFAHVLFRDEKAAGPPWTPLDGLKLWGAAGWVQEDSPYIPFLLPPLVSLDELLGGHRPAVDDRVLLSFLTASPGGSFDDPAGVIAPRWRELDAARRCGLFVDAFRGFLETSGTAREPFLLVVEPSVAALVFYGIVRLLPPGGLRDRVSFSTFEPNADRVGASLAATTFHDPHKTDLRADAYRSRGFALNTHTGRRSEIRRPEARYAEAMVRRLLERGWGEVDRTLAGLASAGARRAEDLEALAAVDGLVPTLLDPAQTRHDDSWRRSPMATSYLRQALVGELNGLANPYASLEAIVGRPAHLVVLELIAAEPEIPGTRGPASFLLERLPGEKIGELLKMSGIAPEAKVDVLARYVAAHAELPPGCDHLWNESARGGTLLPSVLARLDPNTLEGLYRRVADQHAAAFLLSLSSAYREGQCPQSALARVVGAMDNEAVLALFRSRGAAFFREYPEDEPTLGAKLHALVESLAEHVPQFPERLDAILAGRRLLPDRDQDVVTGWSNCRRAILDVGQLQDQRSGVLRKPPLNELEAASRRMAEEARKAMPPDRLEDDRQGSKKQALLREIGQRLLDGRPLLPRGVWQHDALWQKIAWYFQHRSWSSAPLAQMYPRSRSLRGVWIVLGTIAAIACLVVAIGALRLGDRSAMKSRDALAASGGTGSLSARGGPARAGKPPVAPTSGESAQTAAPRENTLDEPDEPIELPSPAPPAEPAIEEPIPEVKLPAAASSQPVQDPFTEGVFAPEGVTPEPPTEEPAPGTVPPQADTWKQQAEQFAREHAGKFFDEVPLVRGELRFTADDLPPATSGGSLFLGGGVLHFERGMLPFGAGFNERPPVVRHEVPQLAGMFGFPSVYVELQARREGSAVVLGVVPQSLPPDAEKRKKDLLDQLERNARMIVPQLRTYNSRTATDAEKDAAFDKLVKLTGIEIPAVPPKPHRSSPEYADNPQAYDAALEKYNQAVTAHSRAKESVVPTARQAVSTVDDRKKSVEDEFRRYQEQLQEHNRKGEASLLKQCQRISVIVYRAVEGTPGGTGSLSARGGASGGTGSLSARGGAARADKPPVAPPDQPIQGRFRVDQKPAQGLKPPATAQLRPIVTGEAGRPLPPWFHEKIVTGFRIDELDADGFLLRSRALGDITAEKTADVFEKTAAARCRFEFFPRGEGPSEQRAKAPIAAVFYVLERIEEGKQYTLTLELGKDAIEWLRLLAANPD